MAATKRGAHVRAHSAKKCLPLSRAILAAEGDSSIKPVHRRWDPKLRVNNSDQKQGDKQQQQQQQRQHEADQRLGVELLAVDEQRQASAKCPQGMMGTATALLALPCTPREVYRGRAADGADFAATPSTCAPSEENIFLPAKVQQHGPGAELQRPLRSPHRACSTAPVGLQYHKAGQRSDKYTRGAHFKHVVPCRFFPGETDEDKENGMDHLDAQLGTMLRGVEGGYMKLPSEQDNQPLPMATAFTDRSARSREGCGMREAMSSNQTNPANNANGSSPLGQLFLARPAGQLSCKMPGNQLPVSHRGRDAACARNKVSKQTKQKGESEEVCFRRAMGVKAKQPVMQADKQDSTSSRQQKSADADKLPAGCCSPRRFDIELESSPHYARRHCPADGGSGVRERCDVAMIVSPKESDPPPPRQITDCVKAGGACKEDLSQSTLARQQLDARSVLKRSRSLPPEPTRNPITSGDCGSGTIDNWECHNSSRPMLFVTAEVAELTNHTLLSMEAVDRRAERLACEQKFADLCTLTEATASMGSRSLAQSWNESSSMGSALAWNA